MKKPTYYFDFSKKGQDYLGIKDIPVIKNDQAVKEGIINLLSTEVGTRPMHPEYGVDLSRYLFEPIDDITSDLITYNIELALERFEPRVSNVAVTVIPPPFPTLVEDNEIFARPSAFATVRVLAVFEDA